MQPRPEHPPIDPPVAEHVVVDPATVISLSLAEIDVAKAQLEIALKQLPDVPQPYVPLRDLSPLGRG